MILHTNIFSFSLSNHTLFRKAYGITRTGTVKVNTVLVFNAGYTSVSTLSIDEISYMFVYINPSNFYKAFQEYYEYAPTEKFDLFLFFVFILFILFTYHLLYVNIIIIYIIATIFSCKTFYTHILL